MDEIGRSLKTRRRGMTEWPVVKSSIRAWSDNTETGVVLLLAFGLPVVGSLYAMMSLERSTPPITSPHLLRLLVSETVLGILIASLLRARGWTLARLGLRLSWRDLAWGLVLIVASYVAYYAVWIGVANLWSGFAGAVASTHLVARGIPLPISVAVSIVNPLFEEVFVCGYVIAALKERIGTAGAINVSMGIRLVCHLYQGPVGVVSIVPIGLVYAFYFARTGRLWPVILAHAVEDLLGLLYGR